VALLVAFSENKREQDRVETLKEASTQGLLIAMVMTSKFIDIIF